MSKSLTLNDLDKNIRDKISVQNYSQKKTIEDVKIIERQHYLSDDGDFTEILKIKNNKIDDFADFKIAQINRSNMLPNTLKAWHLHFKQNEIWHIPKEAHLLMGLWDVRESSPTKGVIMRLILGGGKTSLLYIPKGIAHGALNILNKTISILYFIDQIFDSKNPDEQRLSWDILGSKFWQSSK